MTRSDPNSNTGSTSNALDRMLDSNWQRAHAELERLARTRARLESEEGYWLLRALRSRAHVELGYGSFAEYIERLFGYPPRWTQEKLRVAEALEKLPELVRALSGGVLSWSAVRELSWVATAATEVEWIEAARGKRSRELERQVSGRRPGDRPGDGAHQAVRHVLRFEVCAETLAAVREAIAKLRRDSGSTLDDDAALLLMARHVLGGPADNGRASYQMLLGVCEKCGRAELEACGELVVVGPEVLQMASCDAQRVRAVDAQRVRAVEVDDHTEADRRSESEPVNPVGRKGADPREHESKAHVGHRSETRSSRAAEADVRREAEPDARTTLARVLPRATQDVPPAVRRWVMRRDRGCCVVQGCNNAVFVDIHHLRARSEGGDHDTDGLVVLRAAHHRAVHRGQLVIEGSVATGLVFRHADGQRYGQSVSAAAATAGASVFRALRSLGFSELETRRALEKTRSTASEFGEAPSVECLLRRTLAVLTERRELTRHAHQHRGRTGGLSRSRAPCANARADLRLLAAGP
jgi:hypothetical protein